MPCVTPRSAVDKISWATGVAQEVRTVQGPKGAFIFTRKGREDNTQREEPSKALWEATEEAPGGQELLQP